MEKIRFTPHFADQQNVLVFDRRIGYCGTKPNMPVNFLHPKECGLTDEEKREVMAFVIGVLARVKPTPQTLQYFPTKEPDAGTADEGSDPIEEGCEDRESPMP